MKWEKILMPTGLDLEASTRSANRAELVLQPLESGFGLTIGNALRRTLLSSIQGAAIGAVGRPSTLERRRLRTVMTSAAR